MGRRRRPRALASEIKAQETSERSYWIFAFFLGLLAGTQYAVLGAWGWPAGVPKIAGMLPLTTLAFSLLFVVRAVTRRAIRLHQLEALGRLSQFRGSAITDEEFHLFTSGLQLRPVGALTRHHAPSYFWVGPRYVHVGELADILRRLATDVERDCRALIVQHQGRLDPKQVWDTDTVTMHRVGV